MLEVLQAKSHGHLHKLESNRRMIPDLQIPWIYILLEIDLHPLADSCHWSETARRLVAADRRPLQVVYGNFLVADRSQIMHDPGHQKYLRPMKRSASTIVYGCTSVSDLLKTTHDHQNLYDGNLSATQYRLMIANDQQRSPKTTHDQSCDLSPTINVGINISYSVVDSRLTGV